MIETEEIEEPICYNCYSDTDVDMICTKCDEFFCYNCGAHSTYHRMIDYNCCASCADQGYGMTYKELLEKRRLNNLKRII